MRIFNCRLIFLIIPVIWLNAFDSSILFAQKIETIDGIRVVSNDKPMWENEPKVSLSFVQRIGVLESKDENYMFYQPFDVALDSDENIYVLDGGNLRIQKFDTNGKFLSSFGRKGWGPAEFEYIERFDIAKNGDLYVGDRNKRLMIVINQDGKEVRRFRFEKQVPAGFNILESGEIIIQTQGEVSFDLESHTTTIIDVSKERLMRKFDTNG
ncbi:6-bladed beta-propeller, partial [candidate division KSB1 bacterium]|nr:6-bladed beta-propeller [candidate division KSB1 bacterium]